MRTTTAPGWAARTARSPAALVRPYAEAGLVGASSDQARLAVPPKT